MAFCTLGWHLHFKHLSSAVLIYLLASWLPTWHQFAPSPCFGWTGSLWNTGNVYVVLEGSTPSWDSPGGWIWLLHFHSVLAVSWKCPVSVLALFSLSTLLGLRGLYLQEILETGNNYENILRSQGSSIILKMEKDGLFLTGVLYPQSSLQGNSQFSWTRSKTSLIRLGRFPTFSICWCKFLRQWMCDISQSQETLSIYSWGLFLLNESSAFNVQICGRKVVCGAGTEQLETPRHSLSVTSLAKAWSVWEACWSPTQSPSAQILLWTAATPCLQPQECIY